MTDEQFNALAPFEGLFKRALDRKTRSNDYPGRAALDTMVNVIRATNPRYRTNYNCSVCILHTIQDAARIYFGEKKDREKAQDIEVKKVKVKVKKATE